MASTCYQTVNGRLRSGVRRDYLTDALGSVTATVNTAGAVENTYRYKPYGDRLGKTGSAADPRFQWTGDTGSRATGKKAAEQYNRRRHYGNQHATWTTIDPLILTLLSAFKRPLGATFVANVRVLPPSALSLYVYVSGNPTSHTDRQGLDVKIGPVPPGTNCNGANAVTWCNFDQGKPYTLLCNSKCDAPCTDAHEGQHRYDISSCCSRAAKCSKKHSAQECERKFLDWANCNRNWAECRGYRVGRLCREKMIGERDCYKCKPITKCCEDLINGRENDNRQIAAYCRGVDPFGSPPCACPFTANGDIR